VLLVFFPGFLLGLLGISVEGSGLFTAQLYGATLFGNLMLTWYAKDSSVSKARDAIMLDLFVYDAIGLVVTLIYLLNGSLNWLGWGIAVVYLFFTVGFGYFWFTREK
jgi:hypothetical protein